MARPHNEHVITIIIKLILWYLFIINLRRTFIYNHICVLTLETIIQCYITRIHSKFHKRNRKELDKLKHRVLINWARRKRRFISTSSVARMIIPGKLENQLVSSPHDFHIFTYLKSLRHNLHRLHLFQSV